jgi:hypothetical protein
MEVVSDSRFFVALWVVAAESGVDKAAALVDLDTSAVATNDVVHTGVDIGSAEDHLAHLFSVSSCDTDWHGQFLGNLCRHTNFVNAEVGVR